jgi:curved DNA-binding protein CbpA
MNELHRCYQVLGLEPGASLIEIQERYKIVILAWHPDRFSTDKQKKHAEEELKKINNARDKLKEHFERGGHNFAGGPCACKPEAASDFSGGSGSKQSSGSQSHRRPDPAEEERKRKAQQERKHQEEAEARRRDEERRKQKEDEARRQAEEQRAWQEQLKQQAMQEAARQEEEAKDRQLRWKVSFVMLAIFLLFFFGSWIVRNIATGINSAQYSGLADKEKELGEKFDQLRQEKKAQYEKLVGREATRSEIDNWQPPYEKPQVKQEPPAYPVPSFGGGVTDSGPVTTPGGFQYQPPQPGLSDAEIRVKNQELINSLQEQLQTINQSLADFQAENESINRQIVEAKNNAQYYSHQADELQSRLRVDFLNSAADRRWYPQEHSQWKAYLFQAGRAAKTAYNLEAERDSEFRKTRRLELEQQRDRIQSKLQSLRGF